MVSELDNKADYCLTKEGYKKVFDFVSAKEANIGHIIFGAINVYHDINGTVEGAIAVVEVNRIPGFRDTKDIDRKKEDVFVYYHIVVDACDLITKEEYKGPIELPLLINQPPLETEGL